MALDNPDLSAAARSAAATELVEAFASWQERSDMIVRDLRCRSIQLRLTLTSNGVDVYDLEQAATVAAVLRSILTVDKDAYIALCTAMVTATEAFTHGIQQAER